MPLYEYIGPGRRCASRCAPFAEVVRSTVVWIATASPQEPRGVGRTSCDRLARLEANSVIPPQDRDELVTAQFRFTDGESQQDVPLGSRLP